jgi:hypothetical protein
MSVRRMLEDEFYLLRRVFEMFLHLQRLKIEKFGSIVRAARVGHMAQLAECSGNPHLITPPAHRKFQALSVEGIRFFQFPTIVGDSPQMVESDDLTFFVAPPSRILKQTKVTTPYA